MNDRPTPETEDADYVVDSDERVFVCIDFARRLERERDEAREQAAFAWKAKSKADDYVVTIKRERDEAREHAENLQETIKTDRQVSAGEAMYRGGLLAKVASLEKKIDGNHAALLAMEKMLYAERALADRLGDALEQCAEDSEELLGERAWWAKEPRCRYQERYLETVGNKERASLAIKAWKEARNGKA